jgi:hypothetical protein
MIIFLGLGLTPHVSFSVACLCLISYLLLSVLVFVRTTAVGEFKLSYSKLGPTEIRVIAILLNTGMYFGGVRMTTVSFGAFGKLTFSPYDLIVGAITLLLLSFFIVTAVRETINLSKADK